MPKKLTKEDFIRKAKEVHGDKYDYSNVKYTNSKTKVKIICKEHGIFFQCPAQHLYGQGCRKCGIKFSHKSIESRKKEFIEKASKVHDEKYNYKNITYTNSQTKIEIICPIHGSFFQKPIDHSNGHGCPKCAHELSSKTRTKSQEQFIQEANAVHSNKYQYSEYTNASTKIKIICPHHGEFWQKPNDHLNGHGCPKCANQSWAYTTKEYIDIVNTIHNNKYTYPNLEYKNNKQYININCPIHGIFQQKALNHIQGQGCPKCSGLESPQELKIRKLLKENGITFQHNTIVDERYPWHVDIFIPERELFIEYNGFWTHHDHWYNPRSSKDRKKKNELINKFPDWSPLSWWTSDIDKKNMAKKNNLNYVVLWNEQDIEDWFALGCPDGHDGDGMYTWK